jgi:glycosyltransferase involved in cell wall biosynthesis
MGMTMYDAMQVSEALRISDDYDIVHDHSGFLGVAFSHMIKVPVLHTLHGPFTVDTSTFYTHFKDACYFNAISEYQRSCLPILNYVNTVYNGIDIQSYEYSEDKDDYLILVSRVNPNKGTHLAIQVAKELGEKLVLVGKIDPIDMEYFQTQVEPEIDGEQIVFMGEVGGSEKRELIKRAKCFVFPIQWPEPFGLVMAEAMACGTPVVALRNGSSSEVVVHGKVGYVVDTLNEMVEAVKMVSDIDPRVCRDYVLANFSPEKMADGYEENYRKILEQR